MSDVFSLFDEEVDASKFDKVNEDKGKTLSDLIRQSMKIDEEIAQAEQYLKDLKFKKRKVNEEDIPSLMQEMGMDSVTVDGNKVALRQFVHARIPEEKKDEAVPPAGTRSKGAKEKGKGKGKGKDGPTNEKTDELSLLLRLSATIPKHQSFLVQTFMLPLESCIGERALDAETKYKEGTRGNKGHGLGKPDIYVFKVHPFRMYGVGKRARPTNGNA